MPTYTVALVATTALNVGHNDVLLMHDFPSAAGPVTVEIRTRYVPVGHEVPIPRGLAIDVRGDAPSLDIAIEAFAEAIWRLVPLLVVVTNASIDDVQVELAYDSTPGAVSRDFYQRLLIEPPPVRARLGRSIKFVPWQGFIQGLHRSAEYDRVQRACYQYSQALAHWRPGSETLALAHLFMGAEALTKASLRDWLKRTNSTEAQLARAWGLIKDEGEDFRRGALEAEARKRRIFQGDEVCHSKAKAASDGFEHGFKSLEEIADLARDVCARAAVYLRAAIIEILQPPLEAAVAMRSPPFAHPLPIGETEVDMRVRLIAATDQIAAPGERHPRLRWETKIENVARTPEGGFHIQVHSVAHAHFADGVSFEPAGIDIRHPTPEPDDNVRVEVVEE